MSKIINRVRQREAARVHVAQRLERDAVLIAGWTLEEAELLLQKHHLLPFSEYLNAKRRVELLQAAEQGAKP